MGIDNYLLEKFRLAMTLAIVVFFGFFQLNSALAIYDQIEVSHNVETFEFHLEHNDDFQSRTLDLNLSDFPDSILRVSVFENAQFTWDKVNAAKSNTKLLQSLNSVESLVGNAGKLKRLKGE